jgi:hypothetical protein
MKSKIAPSRRPILSFDRKYHKRRFAINAKIATFEKALKSILKGDDIKVTPRMQVMFMKQLPTMLPSAKPKCPFLTESMLVASSGMLVPKAITVAPMTSLGMPILNAK